MRQFVQRAIHDHALILLPAVVLAETTRGGPRDAPVNRIVNAVDVVVPIDAVLAREAGRLLSRVSLTHATLDALVVASAAQRESTILLTGDIGDITALAAGYPHVRVQGI